MNWPAVIELADRKAVLPTLAAALTGDCDVEPASTFLHQSQRDAHEPYVAALRASLALNAARNARLARQCADISARLAAVDCPTVFLKGMGQILGNTYPLQGARLTTDIDVLVPRNRLGAAVDALLADGYTASGPLTPQDGRHHLAPLVRRGELAAVELHFDFAPGGLRCLSPSSILAEARPVLGVDHGAVPSPTHAAILAVAHSMLRGQHVLRPNFHVRDGLDLLWSIASHHADLRAAQDA
ncbi:MAG: nucleotidyltransferase family protein, partial [Pseudomonadota bacterium]